MQILYCCEAHSLSSCLLSVERHCIYFYYLSLCFSESPYAYIYSIFDIFKVKVSFWDSLWKFVSQVSDKLI